MSDANDFEIIGAVENSELSYGVVGQSYAGEVASETYYITCGLDGVDRKLIVKVTFTNLAKVKLSDDNLCVEPCISIWSIDGKKITSQTLESLQSLINSTDAAFEYSYR
ncbi:MAG: hypothetical protein MJ091_06415, partial [Clostridia bacterium]|nr:hypothetical protein [Clostridia bacterium]